MADQIPVSIGLHHAAIMFYICSHECKHESSPAMRWSRDGVMHPTCILEAATFQQSVKLSCRCGHNGRFEAHGLWWHFERRGWDDRFAPARIRFWCRVCASREGLKVRPVRLEPVPWQTGDVELPWPDERRWKRATARLR